MSELPPRALTLWPEWAYAIAHLGKRVENRTWEPPASLIGQRIAIHAGKHVGGRAGAPAMFEGACALIDTAEAAGVVGVIQNAVGRKSISARQLSEIVTASAIVATARLVGFDREQRTPWDVPGMIHWRLEDVLLVDPVIPCSGRQGLWATARIWGS